MSTTELKEFMEERLRAFDPDIDLTEGSPAQLQVVDPVVRRFTPDPFEMDVAKFISARLEQEFPTVNFREGSGVYDLLVKAAQVLLDPISREVQLIKQGQSMANPELLASTEADALAGNLFISRETGGLATGTARLYFNAPMAVNISVSNVCYTSDGLRFIPTTLQSISAEAMVFNQSGNLYYFDIQLTAESPGEAYNVEAHKIIGITNLNAAVRVDNLYRFSDGLEEESTDDLVAKAETSITERSLVVPRGVSSKLSSQFSNMTHLQVVGAGDVEMGRDVIVGGDMGPPLLSGGDGYTEDDGDGDGYTSYFKVRYGDAPQDPFLSFFGAVGAPADEYYLTLNEVLYGIDGEINVSHLDHFIVNDTDFPGFTEDDVNVAMLVITQGDLANVGSRGIKSLIYPTEVEMDTVGEAETDIGWVLLRPVADYQISEIISARELKVVGNIPVDRKALVWSIRKKELTLSNIPGGIIFSDDAAAITLQSDEVHIGGHTDFYVRGTSVDEEELVLSDISDENPLLSGLGLVANFSLYLQFVYRPGIDWSAYDVRVGYSLVIESGVNAGTYTVIRVGTAPLGAPGYAKNYLQIDPALSGNDPDMRYRVVDDIDINLREPRTMRGSGLDLQTVQLSQTVTTAAAVDFLALGVDKDDTLRILEGPDAGDYSVLSVSGVGNKNLTISAQMKSTSNSLRWELFRPHDPLRFPLVRISSIDILDSSNQPTGDTVPYADPVDAKSSAFSNAARGTKVSISDAVTGIVGTVDLSGLTYPLATTVVLSMEVNFGGLPINITLTGATSVNDLINKINAEIFNIADTLEIDGEIRLTLRSGDRWLRVLPEASSDSENLATVGLDPLGEDNRQIKSAGAVSDWTVYNLIAEKDVVYIKTGDNIGYLYLIAVSSSKILAVGYDEVSRCLRYLHPNTAVSIVCGSRSYGKARVYFLEPTSFEVHGAWHPSLKNTDVCPGNAGYLENGFGIAYDEPLRTCFTATVAGSEMRFFPDPDLQLEVLPCATEDVPNNLLCANSTIVTSENSPPGALGKDSRNPKIDFLLREFKVGDLLDITVQPVQGSTDIRDTTDGGSVDYSTDPLDGKTLVLTLEGCPTKTLTFSDQIEDEDDVVAEINAYFGTVAYLETISGPKYLRLEVEYGLTVHGNGTANSILGLPLTNTTNEAVAHTDTPYSIIYVGDPTSATEHYKVQLSASAAAGQAQHFKVYRPGNQRIHSTLMNANIENGLYYVDIELVSEGVGDEWNLDPDTIFVLSNYDSDGYRLVVEDANYSYSTEERVSMSLSRRLLTVGSTDRPDQETTLSSQNLQVNYDRSSLVEAIQLFARSDLERVLCANILVRHLQPHYINFIFNYRGGSSSSVVEADILSYLASLGSTGRVESSSLVDIAKRRSADYVQSPIELVAVVHNENRSITVVRSEDYVSHGRLATFFVGTISVTREATSIL